MIASQSPSWKNAIERRSDGAVVARGRRDDPVQRRDPPIVGPLREQVADVDQVRARLGDRRRTTRRTSSQQLEAGHTVGPEHVMIP